MEAEPDQKEEALRLKTIAETKYSNSNIKSALKHAKKAHSLCPNLDGLSSLLTALKILRVASKTHSDITDWYKILQVEPFSHINTIKKQYKKLALILHPDKNPYLGCEEAFKLVGEGFRVLSDKIRRKEYDMRLRIKLQEERVNDNTVVETFWTACSRCRLLHQFERRYLGHNLVCPSCKKSFEAVEVEEGDKEDGIGAGVRIRSERLRRKVVVAEGFGNLGSKKKMGNDSRVKPRGGGRVDELNSRGNAVSSEKTGSMGLRSKVGVSQMGDRMGLSANLKVHERGSGAWSGGRLRTGGLRRKMSTVDEVLERSKPKRVKVGADMMTLAEMQLEAKKKSFKEKAKLKEKEKQKDAMKKRTEKKEKLGLLKKLGDTNIRNGGASKKSGEMDLEGGTSDESEGLGIKRRGASEKRVNMKVERPRGLRSGGLEIMAVKDSDFYDFDRDRVERSFKKGQVWALYDDDRIPRHYGLIDEVVSVNPFEVELSWLELQCNGNERLICWEKMGFHMSCGRFKVSRKTIVNSSLNIFSHVVDCERAAREVYRIYPKKGSVWALYNEVDLSAEARNPCARDKQCYEIVVFLTTYSEMHGLSMAYLEKVDGFKTVFKRREVGCHAIRSLENGDVRLLSHQIPARKLSADEVPAFLKDCWELDPALLTSDLLAIG